VRWFQSVLFDFPTVDFGKETLICPTDSRSDFQLSSERLHVIIEWCDLIQSNDSGKSLGRNHFLIGLSFRRYEAILAVVSNIPDRMFPRRARLLAGIPWTRPLTPFLSCLFVWFTNVVETDQIYQWFTDRSDLW
jgi:hypothetical protein